MAKHRATRRRSPRRRVALCAGLTLALALITMVIGSAIVFLSDGGKMFVVRTPSMGTAAPVGTLVLTTPVTTDRLHVGDVIAFHPPSSPGETFTHRVVAVGPEGVHTRGDVNGARDPWTLTSRDLVGRTVLLAPGFGWLLRATPYFVGGGVLVWVLTRLWISPRRRGPARLFGAAVVFLVTVQVLRPFVGVAQLASGTDAKGATAVAAVSTGLLPIRLTPADGSGHAAPLDLAGAGRTGTSVLTGGKPGARFELNAVLHLSPVQWLAVVLLCASPLLWTLLIGFRDPEASGTRGMAAPAAPVAPVAPVVTA